MVFQGQDEASAMIVRQCLESIAMNVRIAMTIVEAPD